MWVISVVLLALWQLALAKNYVKGAGQQERDIDDVVAAGVDVNKLNAGSTTTTTTWEAEEEETVKHVLFVSIPVFRHVDPLVEIAKKLVQERENSKGKIKVSMAYPDWFDSALWNSTKLGKRRRFDGIETHLLKNVANPLKDYDEFESNNDIEMTYGNVKAENLRKLFEKTMSESLIDTFSKEKQGKIHLVVTDRYTWAGYNFAHYENIQLVVHNPWTLLDIDSPPSHILCPMSGLDLSNSLDLMARLKNMYERFKLVLKDAKESTSSFLEVRKHLGLEPLDIKGGRCSRRLVLTDSVLGLLDEARPLPPLQQVVGAVTPDIDELLVSSKGKIEMTKKKKKNKMSGKSSENKMKAVILIQGFYSKSELDFFERATLKLGIKSTHVGERCINDQMVELCGSETPVILLTNGDIACVQLAALCGNFEGILIRPKLPEQVELAARLKKTGIGEVLIDGKSQGESKSKSKSNVDFGSSILDEYYPDYDNSDGKFLELQNSTSVAECIRTAIVQKPYRQKLARLANALRLAGGTPHVVYWIRIILDLGVEPFLPLGCDLPFIQRLLLDVYFFYFCVLMSVAVIFRTSWSLFVSTLIELEEEQFDQQDYKDAGLYNNVSAAPIGLAAAGNMATNAVATSSTTLKRLAASTKPRQKSQQRQRQQKQKRVSLQRQRHNVISYERVLKT